MTLTEELEKRGLIEALTHEAVKAELDTKSISFYAGFDPTATSLHVGQLALFNLMSILQRSGHKPVGLMGGATGMIGDPGGKSAERNLQTVEKIAENIKGISAQLTKFLGFEGGPKATIVNNMDWLGSISYIDFLRDVGKHFSVNQMVQRDSVKSRLEGAGISYTEFSYMLLQAYDFAELAKSHDVTLQIGGSDQWGNIVSGTDLARRLGQKKQLFGMTMPLVTKSDGSKFGKSESGTIWLSPELTSPYAFYQFFLRTPDEDVIRFLKVFTQVDLDVITELEESVKTEAHLRKAQKALAQAVTTVVHGADQLTRVEQASQVLFGQKIENLDDKTIGEIFAEVPSTKVKKVTLEAGWSLIDALVETEACKSKGQARKLIEGGGVYLNNNAIQGVDTSLSLSDLASESYLVIRTGKKNYRLVEAE
ncbi:MAG: tyrosine--tRNA ligase [SAR324 cluster bacterium]|nr:tyrosine--tRNA ligase [SAR324 cluster bacterium]